MPSPVEEIKARLDIADVIGEYVRLKPAGVNLKGVCPFHREKTPSFMVHRGRQRWHCFGCNEGGDLFTFIEKIENVDFREALELLAKRANIELKAEDPKARSERARMKEALALAVRWFRAQLRAAGGAEALRYVKEKRGLGDETITAWQIGYAPNAWEGLTAALQKRGVTMRELIGAGLAVEKKGGRGCYDRFRDRVMFPIADAAGTVVGFTGRLLHEHADAGGKYVNTPETVLYKKSAVLFGLDKARESVREKKYMLVVEGQMDVISLWQAGFGNVVAASGTAFTSEQLRLLKRYTDTLALCFDADTGGEQATQRSVALAWQEGFRVDIVAIPGSQIKDPDEFVRKDPEGFAHAVQARKNFMDYYYEQAFARYDPASLQGKKSITSMLLGILGNVTDPIEQDHFLKKLAGDLGADESSLKEAMRRAFEKDKVIPGGMPAKKSAGGGKTFASMAPSEESLAGALIALMVARPILMGPIADIVKEEDMPDTLRSLYREIRLWYSEGVQYSSDEWIRRIEASYPEEWKQIETHIVQRELSDDPEQALSEQEALSLAKHMRRIALKKRIGALSRLLKNKEQGVSSESAKEGSEQTMEEVSGAIEQAMQALDALDRM